MVGHFIADALKQMKPFSEFSNYITVVRHALIELYFACGSDVEFEASANVFLHLAYVKTTNESSDFRFEISPDRTNIKVFLDTTDMFKQEPILDFHCPDRPLVREADLDAYFMLLSRLADGQGAVFVRENTPILIIGSSENSAVEQSLQFAAKYGISLRLCTAYLSFVPTEAQSSMLSAVQLEDIIYDTE